ncbi:unnamed protein product [Lactuca saligna]|uniref:Serine-threonine/tyrosine-protein kinase catalytic domain-containing protein n=1 Tax=Lactuca saligna TaxID=75948 RepID=A0AA35Z7C8_LACSI|nr:unnamed protein product [Lactuca saligna]
MHHAISHCSIFITKFETIFRKESLYILLLPVFIFESFKWVSFHIRKRQIHLRISLDKVVLVLFISLLGGQETAMKRLQEFRNEVTVIAKLQHRNLVRLLRYCVRGDEKILLYKDMPIRSLDSILSGPKLCTSLDWHMRFNIIMGIA